MILFAKPRRKILARLEVLAPMVLLKMSFTWRDLLIRADVGPRNNVVRLYCETGVIGLA